MVSTFLADFPALLSMQDSSHGGLEVGLAMVLPAKGLWLLLVLVVVDHGRLLGNSLFEYWTSSDVVLGGEALGGRRRLEASRGSLGWTKKGILGLADFDGILLVVIFVRNHFASVDWALGRTFRMDAVTRLGSRGVAQVSEGASLHRPLKPSNRVADL